MKKKSKQTLQQIQEKRTGGAIAIRGFNFQFIYSAYQILLELSKDNNNSIGLEGIEDIDIPHKNEFIQVKSSINSIDSNIFWKMGVLKNYLEVYQSDFNINFKLVHNTTISNGHLKSFEKGKFNKKSLDYWTDKIQTLNSGKDINIEKFLKKIKFEKTSKDELIAKSKKLLLEKFDLNNGTEEQFLIALLYQITQWSEERKTVQYQDLLQVIQFVTDNFSKTPTNLAIKENWITKVNYDYKNLSTDMGYFDGKSAKPIHIALRLPIKRTFWIDKIEKEVKEFDITVIKSSSGQGKSTLAWQVAQDFKEFGYTIYQLNYCHDYTKVEDLFDFIETRIKIGEIPLIVIDGLDQRVKKWTSLAERLFSFPIKIVVTTREEDWYRYGIDVSKVQLKVVDIELLQNEAKDIFVGLQKRDKIHQNIQNWQSVWEQVASKKLLIEYVYLLTHGKMIEERLAEQIKELNREDSDVKAKLEILRIIALADICNIQIQTKKLTKYIQKNIEFKSDRGELYKMLNNEYFIQVDENKKYIEGLHPVRSQHLIDILHEFEFVYIEESLIALLKIIDDESVYDYFIKVIFLVDEEEREDFLEESAEIIANREFAEMVQAIDGLMYYEVDSYWLKNRRIYDEVYQNGKIKLFLMHSVPLLNLDSLDNLIKMDNPSHIQEGWEYLKKEKAKLSKYIFEQSYLATFVYYLSQSKITSKSYYKLDHLIKWFDILKVEKVHVYTFNEQWLLNSLEKNDIQETLNLYSYFYLYEESKYLNFIEKNKVEILSLLKVKISALKLEEYNNEIYIEYLANPEKMDKLNECSMQKIDIMKVIFPHSVKYNTEAIYLPFPNKEFYELSIHNSIKHIENKNLFDDFDVHINRIWYDGILHKYTDNSFFEWLNHYIQIREKLVKFSKNSNRLLELVLEEKDLNKQIKRVEEITYSLATLLKLKKSFPNSSDDENNPFKIVLKALSDFRFSFGNFFHQFENLVDKNSHESHLALYNLKDAYYKLDAMQEAFDKIQNQTYHYFDTTKLKEEEKFWIDRTIKTISFYRDAPPQKITFAKEKIAKWWEKEREDEFKEIYRVLKTLEELLGYKIYYPMNIIEKGNQREIVFGINGYKDDELETVLSVIVDLYKVKIDFVNFIKTDDKKATYGLSISTTFLEGFKYVLDGEDIDVDFGLPQPLMATKELLETLNENIELAPENITQSKFIKVMYDIWKLIEYRIYLDKNSDIEREWLEENERKIIISIQENIDTLNDDEKDFVFDIIDEKMDISKEEIVIYMNEKIAIKSEET